MTVTLSLLAVPYRAGRRSETGATPPTYAVTEVVLPGYEGSCATSVSANGIVAGYAWNGSSCTADNIPFLWRDGKATTLMLPRGFKGAVPWSCNSRGEVVGVGIHEDGSSYAIYWYGNVCRAIGFRDGHAAYMGVTENGDRVGTVFHPDRSQPYRAFLDTQKGLTLIGDFMATSITIHLARNQTQKPREFHRAPTVHYLTLALAGPRFHGNKQVGPPLTGILVVLTLFLTRLGGQAPFRRRA